MWNYRVCREQEGEWDGHPQYLYSIREVYYEEDGTVQGWSAEPRPALGDCVDDLAETLKLMLADLYRRPIFDMDTQQDLPNPMPPTFVGPEVTDPRVAELVERYGTDTQPQPEN